MNHTLHLTDEEFVFVRLAVAKQLNEIPDTMNPEALKSLIRKITAALKAADVARSRT